MPTLVRDDAASAHLKVIDLASGYRGVPIVKNVTFTVSRGEVACVIGPNGAGKSTLLKAVVGILPTMEGEVQLGEARLTGKRPDQVARLGVGYVPQVRDVFEPLTVRENLEIGATALPRRELSARLAAVIDTYPQLGRMLKRQAGKLSGGERKMLAIGRVLMTEPSLVILDEPTAGLSPKLAGQLLGSYVAAMASRGVAVLLVEQRAKDALAISDFAYVMASGQVKIGSPAKELLARDDIGEIFLGRVSVGAPSGRQRMGDSIKEVQC